MTAMTEIAKIPEAAGAASDRALARRRSCSREEGLVINAINSFAFNQALPSERGTCAQLSMAHFLAALMHVCDAQELSFHELVAMAEQKFLSRVDPEDRA
jgi:hypothetical protein